jgi:hypothetical protein
MRQGIIFLHVGDTKPVVSGTQSHAQIVQLKLALAGDLDLPSNFLEPPRKQAAVGKMRHVDRAVCRRTFRFCGSEFGLR